MKRLLAATLLAYVTVFVAVGTVAAAGTEQRADEHRNVDVDAPTRDADGTAATRFAIYEFRVDGNTTLPTQVIERAVYPFLGPEGSFDRIAEAQAALAAAYKEAGYAAAIVDVPEQAVEDGVVRLLVVEGTVDRVKVDGARYVSGRALRARLPSLRSGSVFHLPSASSEISALANDSRTVAPALQAGSRPGTVDVELLVDDRLPLRGGLSLSNAASANTSQTRLEGSLSYTNLFGRDHSIGLSYQLTPERPDEVNALVGTYIARFRDSRDVLAVYAVRTDSEVSAVGGINVLGSGTIVGARYIRPLAGNDRWSGSVAFGADYKDFDDDTSVGNASLLSAIRYWKGLLSFTATHRAESSSTQLAIGADFAMRHLGNDPQQFADKRFKGETDFFYLTASLRHERALPSLGMSVVGELAIRASEDPLISNEQWALGGRSTVRGYQESEVLADWGGFARLTLLAPLFAPAENAADPPFARWQGRLFVDWQAGALHEPLPGQDASAYLASLGAGLSASGRDGWSGDLDVALPLRDAPFTEAYEPRVLFRLGYDL